MFHYLPAAGCVSYGALSLAVVNPRLVRNFNRRYKFTQTLLD